LFNQNGKSLSNVPFGCLSSHLKINISKYETKSKRAVASFGYKFEMNKIRCLSFEYNLHTKANALGLNFINNYQYRLVSTI